MSKSGKRWSLPVGMVKRGMFLRRIFCAAATGSIPVFQSPSESSTTARKLLFSSRVLSMAVYRSVPASASVAASASSGGAENDCLTMMFSSLLVSSRKLSLSMTCCIHDFLVTTSWLALRLSGSMASAVSPELDAS